MGWGTCHCVSVHESEVKPGLLPVLTVGLLSCLSWILSLPLDTWRAWSSVCLPLTCPADYPPPGCCPLRSAPSPLSLGPCALPVHLAGNAGGGFHKLIWCRTHLFSHKGRKGSARALGYDFIASEVAQGIIWLPEV